MPNRVSPIAKGQQQTEGARIIRGVGSVEAGGRRQ